MRRLRFGFAVLVLGAVSAAAGKAPQVKTVPVEIVEIDGVPQPVPAQAPAAATPVSPGHAASVTACQLLTLGAPGGHFAGLGTAAYTVTGLQVAMTVKPGAAVAQESPRMQKLKQQQFDRRPSAVLKAWAPQPPPEPPKGPKEQPAAKDPLDLEMEAFRRHVTLGEWAAVKKYLAGLPEDEAKAGYKQMLQSLQSGPPGGGLVFPPGFTLPPGVQLPPSQYAERNRFTADDVVGIAAAAPKELDKDAVRSLGSVLHQAIEGGTVVEAVVARLKAETDRPSGAALTARQAAQILTAANQPADSGVFLPPLDKAEADKDVEALNLLARHFLGLHARDSKLTFLEQAWRATQSALANPGPRAEHEEALRQAVELAPRLKAELGQAWLDQSFTDKPERGMDVLAAAGSVVSQGLMTQPHNTDFRLKALKLQKTAVEALLKAAPERAKEWRDTVTLLANVWLKEGEFTYRFAQGSGAARMRRDYFGNYYFISDDGEPGMRQQFYNPQQPQPVSVVDVLTTRPEELWLDQVHDDLRPKLFVTLCQLHLKADEEAKGFPYIEKLAKAQPRQARELVKEFLRVWTKNHDPNAVRGYTNSYFYFYGFERRAESIPLTRSKQERNLVELSEWVGRLRKLDVGDPDEELLAKAFTTCHSSAEVYRADAIEKVFGPMGGLKAKTLSSLAQQMRENLAGLWRKPEEQKDKKTNRKQKDIQAEVLRGYAVALATVEGAMKKFPDDWSLPLARAALMHDENNFRQEIAKSSEYSARRDAAYTEFARAAKLYAAKAPELPEDEQSIRVYEQWFYAGLGACDPGMITEEKVPDPRQPALVRAALLALPGELAEKHLSKFANALFTRMSGVKPAAKFNYLKGGFEIVGDHKQAGEAKKVFDYYKDLVAEIKLEAKIDGASVVGHKKPFGVYVNLRHTRDIERESGGFGRYLQNQNTGTYWSYNYGRPTADYRDKFQEAATDALKEHFEVLSVTFQSDKVNSKADAEYGWRVTPYAYLLVKARGPQVDKMPPLRIDLDFLDTSGYVVLPIESPAVPLDAKPERGETRPARKLQVTQTLDERQAAQGKLILEIKASALGLVPDLDQLLDVAPQEFEVVKTDDQGVSVSKFDPDSDDTVVGSDRTWLVTLQAKPDLPRPPQTFRFASARRDDVEMTYQRYDDADLAPAAPEISLEQKYGSRSFLWAWAAAGAAVLLAGLALFVVWALRKSGPAAAAAWKLPERLTPFTTLGLLERIREEGKLDDGQRAELQQAIRTVERHYFSGNGNGDGRFDLRTVAEDWVSKANGPRST